MDAATERALLTRAKAGDSEAAGELIQAFRRQCEFMSRFSGFPGWLSKEDRMQVCAIGLVRAIDGFDLGSGVRFWTYARYKILHEASLLKARERRRPVLHQVDERSWSKLEPVESGGGEIELRETAEWLESLTGVLSQADRELLLRWTGGETLVAIGKSKGVSKETIRLRIKSAVERIRASENFVR